MTRIPSHITAYAALEKGASLELWQRETGEISPDEVLVKVLACGLCHSDIHCVDDDWKVSRYPLVGGHEVVGEVVYVGANVRHLSEGERVGISWQGGSCGVCKDCQKANENLCDQNSGLIVDGYGGFADYVKVDGKWAFPIPEALETKIAGPLLCAGVTVYASLRDAGMSSGQRIGVVGIGGLGHLALQFAAKLGNKVVAFTTSEDKAQFATNLGASETVILGRDGKFAPPPAPEKRLDILLITATADLDWAGVMEWLDSDGVLSIAAVPNNDVSISVFALQNKRRKVTGSNVGSRVVIAETLQIAADYGIEPLIETFPMSEINLAIEKVRNNEVRYRAVLLA